MIAFWDKDRRVIGKPLEEAVPEMCDKPFKLMFQQILITGVVDKGIVPATALVNGFL
jgi:two-component system sensor histidine kinase VicK